MIWRMCMLRRSSSTCPRMATLIGLDGKIADFHKTKQEAINSTPEGMAARTKAEEEAKTAAGSEPAALALDARKAGIEANARQAAAQGDPKVAGQLLANGSLTLADLKTRGSTPQFIEKSTLAAQKISPQYNPADEVIAESVAKSPAANQFFGSANSLITKGGTLDQLEKLGANIPQHDFPVLNTVDDWQKLARGKGPLAGYAATALGAADDYGKVMGGGAASDHARDAALNIFSQAASPEQRAQAIQATRATVQSQRDSRIGNNQFLKRQYGAEVGGQSAATTTASDEVHLSRPRLCAAARWKLEVEVTHSLGTLQQHYPRTRCPSGQYGMRQRRVRLRLLLSPRISALGMARRRKCQLKPAIAKTSFTPECADAADDPVAEKCRSRAPQ